MVSKARNRKSLLAIANVVGPRLENYKELQCNNILIDTFYKHSQEQKQYYMKALPAVSGASTDQGRAVHHHNGR